MTNATHTPGPWFIGGRHNDSIIPESHRKAKDNPEGYRIASIQAFYEEWADESAANARLIAAAPELLNELKKELSWLQHIKPQITAPESVMTGFDQSIKYISAAIAKAEGK